MSAFLLFAPFGRSGQVIRSAQRSCALVSLKASVVGFVPSQVRLSLKIGMQIAGDLAASAGILVADQFRQAAPERDLAVLDR